MKQQVLLVTALLYSFSSPGQAVTTDTTMNSLNEVIISANKSAETRKTISQQVQLMTARDISLAQAQSTADLLSNTAGIFVQRSQMGGGSPVLRGFEASRILLMIDGVRLNNLIYRSGHLQNILSLDNNSLERVEVLFGPSSTMYGSDALGGVIHMFTQRPEFAATGEKRRLKVNAFSRFGSVNSEFTGHVDVNTGGKKLASFTSLTWSSFGDLRGGENQNPFYGGTYSVRPYYAERVNGVDSLVKNADRYLQVQSAYHQYDLIQKFAYAPNEFITHGLNIQYSNTGNIPRYDRLTDPEGEGLRFAEWYYGPGERLLLAWDLNIKNSNFFFQQMHAGINYQLVEESRHQRRFGKSALQHRVEEVGVAGLSIDCKRLSRDHVLHLGADAQFNRLVSTAEEENIETGARAPLDTRYPDGDNIMNNAAVYLSHTWKINQHLTLNDGVRLGVSSLKSNFEDTTFFRFPFREVSQQNVVYSGSLGLIHIPNDDLKLSLLLSSGFRVPNVDDLAKVFETTPGSLIVPNEDLKPEKTITGEIGITKIYNGKTTWENTLYYTSFFDAIVTDEYAYKGSDSIEYDGVMSRVLASQNKDRAFIYGFASGLRTKLVEDLLFSLNASYTYGRVKTDSTDVPLDHIPPFVMRMGISYTWYHFHSDFYVNYNGWKRLKDYSGSGEDNLQYATPDGMPAWFTVNMRASYRLNKCITVQAGVDNIFDTQYRVFASGINAPGRNVFGVLRFNL